MKYKRIIASILVVTLLLGGCTSSNGKELVDTSTINEAEPVETTNDAETIIENTDGEQICVEEAYGELEFTSEDAEEKEGSQQQSEDEDVPTEINREFYGLNDPELLGYIEDAMYSELDYQIDGDKYNVESVSVVYVSQEYLDEVAYNSKSNIYFGYTLDEVEAQFQGEKYIFTLEDGETVVKPFEEYYDDTFNQIVRNVAIGSGVILICVVVSNAATGTVIGAVFTAAAETGTGVALSSSIISGAMKGIVTGIETKDLNLALKEAALDSSENFKWGAIAGCVMGGTTKAFQLYKSATTLPSWQQAEKRALEIYKGDSQVTFKNGEIINEYSQGSTRPDIVRMVNGHGEAIEVKRYDLENNLSRLKQVLQEQVKDRMEDLPTDYTQRIVLDVRGRGYSTEFTNGVVNELRETLNPIYQNIPIDIIAY